MENIFIILLGLSMIYISSTSRLLSHINMLALQGILLFSVCISGLCNETWFSFELFNNIKQNIPHIISIIFIIFETLVVKSIIIPLFLNRIVRKTNTKRDSAANIPHFYALIISSTILFLAFMIPNMNFVSLKLISPLYFSVSIAVIITSLWLITIKHTILSNIISFITMENGIFLLSLSVASKMPVIVNLGVLLDVFIAVFILGLLVKEIDSEFSDLEVSKLTDLKDYE